jgi:hypothetical protein
MSTMLRQVISGVAVGMVSVSIALLSGCHRTAPAGNATVRGLVAFQGQPLAGGLVVFSPDLDRGGTGKPISAEIAQDGRFQLNIGGDPTISPGWYRVAIAPAPHTGSFSPLDRSVFPPQLARPDQSGLVREVKPGQENAFEFIIEVGLR